MRITEEASESKICLYYGRTLCDTPFRCVTKRVETEEQEEAGRADGL
jgi:hypothetical protein